MKTDYKLPKGVAESWYLMTATGEVYDSKICRGADIVRVWAEMCFGKLEDAQDDILAKWLEKIADEDNWHTRDGQCLEISDDMEDGSITFYLISDPLFAQRVDVSRKLVAVARAAHSLADGAEAGADSEPLHVDQDLFQTLSAALDELDSLPEMPAPYIGTGPAKAEHILGLSDLP